MNFRTEILLEKSPLQIEHSDKILTLGSCFAENISAYLQSAKIRVLENPFGVLYNPKSILNSLNLLLEEKGFVESDLIFHDSEFHSFYHHSSFSSHDKDVCLKNINDGLRSTLEFLTEADLVIITLGTAFAYKHIESDKIVSNCHKIPQKYFERFRLGLDEIINSLKKQLEIIHKFNKNVKVIFTVSPIRHWRDGAVDNQLSKAGLLMAVNEVKNNSDVFYFPSYEIMMDDLRDYRFYENDLLHPNKIAIEYIWNKFRECHISDKANQIIEKFVKLEKAYNHRPRNIYSEKHKNFIKSQLEKINELEENYKYVSLNKEREYFCSILDDSKKA